MIARVQRLNAKYAYKYLACCYPSTFHYVMFILLGGLCNEGQNYNYIRTRRIKVFSHAAPCQMVNGSRRFGGSQSLHHQSQEVKVVFLLSLLDPQEGGATVH
jgi:hypothetical protein